jgi:hypothetical protein
MGIDDKNGPSDEEKANWRAPEQLVLGDTEKLQAEAAQRQKDMDVYNAMLEDCPEMEGEILPEKQRECTKWEMREMADMILEFEEEYPLAELLLITDLTPDEATNHPLREPAKLALIPIVEALNKLKNETDITKEKYDELEASYRSLSKAVGFINKGKVVHR